MSHIYAAMMAEQFQLPRTVNPNATLARHLHLFSNVSDGKERHGAIARAARAIRHPAVPPEMTETAFQVAHSALPFGPSKPFCGRDACPCGSGHEETAEHTFWKCTRSTRLWDLVFAQWRAVTGEKKIDTSQGRVALFGDRSGTWASESEEGEFAGLDEPWAVVHKATGHVILEERNRDAAPKAGTRRTAAQLYQKVQSVTQRIVDMRWRAAVAQRRSDGGAAIAQFRRRWEAPGLAVIVDNAHARLVLFMRDTTRSRWRRHATSAREFRNQQHAPPDPPPADMIEIYTAGDGDARKKGQPPPPAGYGAVVVSDGQPVFEMAGQIIAGRTPNVRTTTENLATLVAFTRAMQWAVQHGMGRADRSAYATIQSTRPVSAREPGRPRSTKVSRRKRNAHGRSSNRPAEARHGCNTQHEWHRTRSKRAHTPATVRRGDTCTRK